MEKIPKIEKLNNHNYFTWKYKIELLLINEDLWDVITDEAPTAAAHLRNWRKRDNKARSTIGLTVEDSQLVHIRDKTTAQETWNALKEIHEKCTLTNRISIYKRIALTRMQENQNIEDHLNTMIGLFQKLSALGDIASEEWKIGMVFASLPASYSTLVTALEARPEDDLRWSLVYSKLLDEYQRQKEQEDASFKQNQEKVLKISTQRETYCYFCKKNSHKMADCFKLKRYQQFTDFEKFQKESEKNNIKNNEVNSAKMLTEKEEEEEDCDFILSIQADTESEEMCKKGPTKCAQLIKLFSKLNKIKIENEVDFEAKINQFSVLFNKFEKVDRELSDSHKIAFVLNALPKYYQKFILKFEKESFTWERFLSDLLITIRKIQEEKWNNSQARNQQIKTIGNIETKNIKCGEFSNGFSKEWVSKPKEREAIRIQELSKQSISPMMKSPQPSTSQKMKMKKRRKSKGQ